MPKMLKIESCGECPEWKIIGCMEIGDMDYCLKLSKIIARNPFRVFPSIPPDCPLPDYPETSRNYIRRRD